MGRQKTSRGLPGASGRDPDPAVQPPFPAFAAAARLRGGAPVDADAALSRWFTPAELNRGGPVVSYARRCLQQADRRSWAAALDAIARYDRAGRTACIRVPRPGMYR
jgi:3-oxoadipate enol-lactonase